MSDLLHEVDEIMRRERLEAFWAENRVYIVGVIVGTILLTAIISGYRSWNNGVMERQSAAVVAMQDAEEYPDNVLQAENLELRSGLRGVAMLNAAGRLVELERPDDALVMFERIGADKRLPGELRDLGLLMSARVKAGQEEADAQALLDGLAPVLKDKNSPWMAHARLEAAVIKADRFSDYEGALADLEKITSNTTVPASLRARAQDLARLYRAEHSERSEQGQTEKTGS